MKGDVTCPGGTCTTKNDWLGTARARLGYGGWNNWLPYITGGAAFGDIKAKPGRHHRQQDQDRLDRGPRRRIRAALELERQARISLRRPRHVRLRPDLRRGRPTTSASRPTSCAWASTTASDPTPRHCRPNDETPGAEPGVFLCGGRGGLSSSAGPPWSRPQDVVSCNSYVWWVVNQETALARGSSACRALCAVSGDTDRRHGLQPGRHPRALPDRRPSRCRRYARASGRIDPSSFRWQERRRRPCQ